MWGTECFAARAPSGPSGVGTTKSRALLRTFDRGEGTAAKHHYPKFNFYLGTFGTFNSPNQPHAPLSQHRTATYGKPMAAGQFPNSNGKPYDNRCDDGNDG